MLLRKGKEKAQEKRDVFSLDLNTVTVTINDKFSVVSSMLLDTVVTMKPACVAGRALIRRSIPCHSTAAPVNRLDVATSLP